MIKVLFVCHGNICRSPMAEFVFKDMVKNKGWENGFEIHSAATSTEKLGNPVHYGTRTKLAQHGISTAGKHAVRLQKNDYEKYDYLLGMDEANIRNMKRIFGQDEEHKISRLLDFTYFPRNIADPWYTGDFETTYQDVKEGCEALLTHIEDTDMLYENL